MESKVKEISEKVEKLNLDGEKPYRRALLIKMPIYKEKGIYRETEIESLYKNIFPENDLCTTDLIVPANQLEFYYYNCESVQDYGWGCAWRCIQTVLGTIRNVLFSDENLEGYLPDFEKLINFDIEFEKMFMSYGKREDLERLYLSCYNEKRLPEYLREKEFAPFETENGWAEPFLAKLILHDFGVEGNLFVLNHYSEGSYAPEQVFEKTLNFKEFKQFLINHFSKPHKLPIIIDDTLITICIVGVVLPEKNSEKNSDKNSEKIENENDKLTLLIADPHVKPDMSGDAGIYHVTLNDEGDFISELNPQKTLYGKRLLFQKNSFMVYAPQFNFNN